MRRTIDTGEFRQALADCRRSAWRFEQQATYLVDYERDQFGKFLAGVPEPPAANPGLRSWFNRVRDWTSAGKTVGRLRIVDDPISDYQRWMQWMDQWNREAGETIDYLSRDAARHAGLLPAAGATDWWLCDDRLLLLMHFDPTGALARVEMVEDELDVVGARAVQDMALRALRENAARRLESGQ